MAIFKVKDYISTESVKTLGSKAKAMKVSENINETYFDDFAANFVRANTESTTGLQRGDWVEVDLNTKKDGKPNIIPVKFSNELYHGHSFLGWAWGERQHEYSTSSIVKKIDLTDTAEIIKKYNNLVAESTKDTNKQYDIKFYQIFSVPNTPDTNGKMIGQRSTLADANAFGLDKVGAGNYIIKAVCTDGKTRYIDNDTELSKTTTKELGETLNSSEPAYDEIAAMRDEQRDKEKRQERFKLMHKIFDKYGLVDSEEHWTLEVYDIFANAEEVNLVTSVSRIPRKTEDGQPIKYRFSRGDVDIYADPYWDTVYVRDTQSIQESFNLVRLPERLKKENYHGEGKYSDIFYSFMNFLEDTGSEAIYYLSSQLIRYCKEEDLKDLWFDRMEQVAGRLGFTTDDDNNEITVEGFRYKGEDRTTVKLSQKDLDDLREEPGKVFNFKKFDIFYGENKGHFPFKPCYYVTYRPSNYTSIFMDDERLLTYINTNKLDEALTEGRLHGSYNKTKLENDLLALDSIDKVDWDLSAYDELGEVIVLTHRAFEDSLDMSTYYMQRTEALRDVLKVFKDNGLKLEDPIEDQGTWWYFVLSEINSNQGKSDKPTFEYMVVEFAESTATPADDIMRKVKDNKYYDPALLSAQLVKADKVLRESDPDWGFSKVWFDNYIRYQGKLYKFHAGRVDLGDGPEEVSLPDDYITQITDYFLSEIEAGNTEIPVVEG